MPVHHTPPSGRSRSARTQHWPPSCSVRDVSTSMIDPTWVATAPFATLGFAKVSTGAQWKRYLSNASLMATDSAFTPSRRASIGSKSSSNAHGGISGPPVTLARRAPTRLDKRDDAPRRARSLADDTALEPGRVVSGGEAGVTGYWLFGTS